MANRLSLDFNPHGLIIVGVGIIKNQKCFNFQISACGRPAASNRFQGLLVMRFANNFQEE